MLTPGGVFIRSVAQLQPPTGTRLHRFGGKRIEDVVKVVLRSIGNCRQSIEREARVQVTAMWSRTLLVSLPST
jgi:hypothetical protein